ncbi:MAG: oxidoreductase, partial [Caballeronia sp.]
MSIASSASPVWFITGCSTGFGREIAQAVLARGWRAVVTARDPDTVADLASTYPDRALPLKLDVTSPDAVAAAVAQVKSAFGRIDVLVNNAGYGYLSAVEEGEDNEVRAMFEVNFFGAVSAIKAVLPVMREQGAGHIVNITSVGGLVGNPGSGYYAATKFALEGLGEALARETAELGIKVTTVEPGPFRTDWAGRSLKQTRQSIDAYA